MKCTEAEEEEVTKGKENLLQLSCFINQEVKYLFTGLKLVSCYKFYWIEMACVLFSWNSKWPKYTQFDVYLICDLKLTSAVQALQSFMNLFGDHWEDVCERELHVNVKQTSAEHFLDPDMVFPMQVTKCKAVCYLFVQLGFTPDWAVSWFMQQSVPKRSKSQLESRVAF